jgi:hypothetical protein
MKHMVVLWFGFVLGLHATEGAFAASTSYRTKAPLPLFASHSVLQLRLRTDFSQLLNRRYGYGTDKQARQLQPVEIELSGTEAAVHPAIATAQVSGRGALRGNDCPFPQLKIDFGKRPGGNSFFRGVKELKMVTHCGVSVTGRRIDLNEQVRMEYLVYRLRQEASDLAFHARLLKVTYEDTSGLIAPFESYAIFVEDVGDLAKRLNVERVYNEDQSEARPELLHNGAVVMPTIGNVALLKRAELKLFQLMIGNHDYKWGHNLKGIFGPVGYDLIPYDFDYAEIFAVPIHLEPPQALTGPLGSLASSDMRRLIADLSRRQQRIIAVVASTELISESAKHMAIQSLSRFFNGLHFMQIPERDVAVEPDDE